MNRIFLALICVIVTLSTSFGQRHSFTVNDTAFLLDGKPFQLISGEMHYPRIPREAWKQRMRMAKAMGINTIGTYAFWNVHEPEKGKFNFSGNSDIAAFIRTAKEEGLWVLLRPSPYVCAEWEFGGYPYWLQNIPGLVVRSKEPQYLREYQRYIDTLGKQLSPLLVTNGGNILMVQVENEYGAYGSDKEYLEINRKMFVDAGFNGLVNSCDPAAYIQNGTIPGLLPGINGDNTPEKVKTIINGLNGGKGPYFMAEWYPAWFDWWGEQHHKVAAEKYAQQLDSVLSAGISINMYMFHGGTTRDFMNGANCYDTSYYQPQVSSYDYNAPLDEAGNATEKFMVFRNVIARHLPKGQHLPDVPAPKPTITLPPIVFKDQAVLFDLAYAPVKSPTPLTFEELGHAYGYVLYSTTIKGPATASAQDPASSAAQAPSGPAAPVTGVLHIKDLRDYAIVFVNGKRQGVLNRMLKQDSLTITVPEGEAVLDILVENLGRINYGPNLLKNKKGITESVSFNGQELKGWEMYSLPFDHVDPRGPLHVFEYPTKVSKRVQASIDSAGKNTPAPFPGVPALKRATFRLDRVADTYLDMRAWGKGCVWINGHNLGRYWEIGPQQTLYVPAEWLKKGENVVEVFELLKPEQNELKSLQKPILDELETGVH